MYFLQSWQGDGAVFEDLQGQAHVLSLADLIDLCAEGRDRQTGQRLPGFAARLAGERLTGLHASGAHWRFALSAGAVLTITPEAIAAVCEPPLWQVQRIAWQAKDAAQLPCHDYAQVIAQDEPLRSCLLQVARSGFARLRGAPTSADEVTRLIARFGAVRETNYGRIFDVVSRSDPDNLADTSLPLAPHTDNPYRADPPDLQILHCLAASDTGGDSVLVDGLAVTEHLRAIDPDAYALLARVPVHFTWADQATRLSASAPAIELGPHGELRRLRCNERSREAIRDPDPQLRQAWRVADAQLSTLLNDPAFTHRFRLAPGDMVILDNRRVMHGRSGFSTSGPHRHLQGAYADADGLYSTLFRLTDRRAARELAALAALFDSAAMAEAYGEEVSIRDHMLQTAELAVQRRLGGAMVVAALLHDVGWGMSEGAHEQLSADVAEPLFGAAIAEPIRHHVTAKRYLVASRPEYHACLSDASRKTLATQGGPMTAAECAAFVATPSCAAALQLRSLDDAAKNLHGAATSFADYSALLRGRILRHLLGQSRAG